MRLEEMSQSERVSQSIHTDGALAARVCLIFFQFNFVYLNSCLIFHYYLFMNVFRGLCVLVCIYLATGHLKLVSI